MMSVGMIFDIDVSILFVVVEAGVVSYLRRTIKSVYFIMGCDARFDFGSQSGKGSSR